MFSCDNCLNNKGLSRDLDPDEHFEIYCLIYGDMDKMFRCKHFKAA